MTLRIFCLDPRPFIGIKRLPCRGGKRNPAGPPPIAWKQRTAAAWSRRPCRNRDLFSPTPPVLRLISGRGPRGLSRFFFWVYLLPRSVPNAHGEYCGGAEEIPPGIADQVKLVFVTTDPAREYPRCCAAGSTVSIIALLVSREPMLHSRPSRSLRGFLRPKKRGCPKATIQLLTQILSSRTRKTIWPM